MAVDVEIADGIAVAREPLDGSDLRLRTGRGRIGTQQCARARLSRNGNGVASGRMTASGRLVLTTGRRVRAGTYRLTVGTTKLTVRIR